MISLKEWGLTRVSYQTAVKFKQRQRNLTSYAFHRGYSPQIIGNTVIIDYKKVFIAFNFKSSKDLAKWKRFEAGLDEVTYQAGIYELAKGTDAPMVKVREIEKLKTSFLKASEGIDMLIDVSRRNVPPDFHYRGTKI